MFCVHRALIGLVLAFAIGSTVAASEKIGTRDKASLQAGMQQYIGRTLVNGIYLYLNPTTGDVRGLHPITAHPMILRMGEFFVLCSDFRDDQGVRVNVDFYMARREKGYVVFHTAVAQRDLLEQLMKAGKIERVD
jgi:hypothetical protein